MMDSDDSDASETSVRDCITVAVLPEDLAAACTDSCRPERCDEATVRPHEEPGVEHGTPGSFTPFEVLEREADIGALPATPIDLFLRYVPYDVVDRWAEWTNAARATA
ncbi:transposable element-derived protein [Colletotrichum kahawae]|uniref:Transposable element-derived protein n=1 Tax=Colletotrichum kahawae TaxID=34407 RepID=A0AAD9YQ16_COLKA|nr:transposable element-derived protein [Colletotrichum kahawae]